MFDILHPDDLPATRWKNGGGLTREIAKRVEGADLVWRLSLADVETDGPFSRFDGLIRILTVIRGAGIDLHSSQGVVPARFGQPVRFSGDLPVEGRLTDGPIRDLNVIFDPARVSAEVTFRSAPGPIVVDQHQTGFLVLQGPVTADKGLVLPGAFALGSDGVINIGPGARGLLVILRPATP